MGRVAHKNYGFSLSEPRSPETGSMLNSTQDGLDATGSKAAPLPGTAGQVRSAQANWYAVYTCPRHEKFVAQQIRQRRVACFLPLYRSVRRWKDRRKELELALFPGYVFVHIAPEERLPVLQSAGVIRFVSFNGHPSPLPESEIESLIRALASGVRAEPHPYLTLGRRVRIRKGPLARAEGILVRRKERCRVVLSLDILMRSVGVEVDESNIEPC